MITSIAADYVYSRLLQKIWQKGQLASPRGMKTKELIGETIVLTNPVKNLITIPDFETSQRYAEAELKWYLSGSNRLEDLEGFANTWKKYSDDGVTVNSAYGYNIFGKNPQVGLDQFEWAAEELRRDPDSRRAIININLPYYKLNPQTKDFPCTIALQYMIRDGKLIGITYMRSNDVYYGFRNDLFCFTELQKLLAEKLDVKYGQYIHVAGSMHLYEDKFPLVENYINTLKSNGGEKNGV